MKLGRTQLKEFSVNHCLIKKKEVPADQYFSQSMSKRLNI